MDCQENDAHVLRSHNPETRYDTQVMMTMMMIRFIQVLKHTRIQVLLRIT